MMIGMLLIAARAFAAEGRFERMAALQETVVSIHERNGVPGLFTYSHDPARWLDYIALGKLRVGVVSGNETLWLSGAKDLKVINNAGGYAVEAAGTVGGVRVKVEAMPTAEGRGNMRREGSALFKISCISSANIAIEWGDLRDVHWIFGRADTINRADYLLDPVILPANCKHEDGDVLVSSGLGLSCAVKVSSKSPAQVASREGVLHCAASGELYLMAGFAEDAARARELAAADPKAVEKECIERFAKLAESAWIKTGSKDLDAAFRAAAINLEYAWVRPYGWIEAIHHWNTLYSQQQNLAADWIGQADRSREMLLSHASKLLSSGQVPQLDPYGRPRLDFGGWNQFYVWGVQHYWEHTGDREFLRQIREPLDRVVDQTFTAHDADGNDLLGFGQQIGNQEDYITTPEDGTSPTIAGIEMKRLQAELALADGRREDAAKLTSDARRTANALRKSLWNADLGRYIFYRDSLYKPHLDGQYHTLIWPVIFDLLDPLDSYTSMRHLADTLTDENGGIFCSNNFPTHVTATVGSQAGGQQQPWATLGWAKLGDAEKAAKPLEWIAEWVMNPANAGSWPEVAEDMPAYFTPPAGVYINGVIEGLFGLKLDRPRQTLSVAPCIPASWPGATLHLPEFDLTVTQTATTRKIKCSSKTALKHVYRVAIPPSLEIEVKANGRKVKFDAEPGVGCEFVCFGLPKAQLSQVEIALQPFGRELTSPARVAAGERFRADLPKGAILEVRDTCGALSHWKIAGGRAEMSVRESTASDAEFYGDQGRKALANRTVFLKVKLQGGRSYWEPVDFTVVPSLRFGQTPTLAERGGKWSLEFEVQGGSKDGRSNLAIEFGGEQKSQTVALNEPCSVSIDERDLLAIHPGMNEVTVTLADGRQAKGRFDGSPLYEKRNDIRAYIATKLRHVQLPKEVLSPDTEWRTWRWWSAYGHYPWAALEPPLTGLDGSADLAPLCCPGLTFANPDRKVAVASRQLARPAVTIPLDGEARKVYLLVLGLLDNQDVFSEVGRVSVKCSDGTVFAKTLRFPGDLDWWGPKRILGGFASVGQKWTDSPAWEAPSSVMNVLEIDLKAMRGVDSLTVETIGRYPALGAVGVTLLGDPRPEEVAKLPAELKALADREPRTLFFFPGNSLEGWEITGSAWDVTDSRGDYWGRHGSSTFFANSMAGGESATGTMTSPKFKITGSQITFLANGHGARNYFALLDASDGSELLRAPAPERTGAFVKITWDVRAFARREVRFKAVDSEDGQAYAWIAFDAIKSVP